MNKKIQALILTGIILGNTTLTVLADEVTSNNFEKEKVNSNSSDVSEDDKKDNDMEIDIPDLNLKRALNEELGQGEDHNPTKSELKSLSGFLNLFNKGIENLTGLEYCTNVTRLDLDSNQISDISPLKDLTSLTELRLNTNQISDISPLENLTSLTHLELNFNSISDISPLENLPSLNKLNLIHNQLTDISSLEKLTSLNELYLYDNQISDISLLKNLTSLTTLDLSGNEISDISPLKNLPSLTSLYASNQVIVKKEINTIHNKVEIQNDIKNKDGSIVAPKTISDSGEYDVSEHLIKWNSIQSDINASYTFEDTFSDGFVYSVFSGTVSQPIKHVREEYKVTFDSQGGSEVSEATVEFEGKVTEPEVPTREGYEFGGWYKESECTTPWDFDNDKMPSSNVTLYAKWILKSTETNDISTNKGNNSLPQTGGEGSLGLLGLGITSLGGLLINSKNRNPRKK